MEDELQPVTFDEFVYRRVHRNHFHPTIPTPVQVVAFRPTEQDTKGLSVYRARFASATDALSQVREQKRGEYYVARLAVVDLQRLGLSVVADPDPNGPRGHAVIPELSRQAYLGDKQRLKDVQEELTKLASADIVLRPA